MRRREFIAGLGGATAWPLVAGAQQRTIPVVGVLSSSTAEAYASPLAAFMQGLKDAGFNEGQNLGVEQRWANNRYDRLPEMAADLVRIRVSLIAAIGNNLPARAAKAATSTIPIVFAMGADPVALGLVASLNRPGGNVTGATNAIVDILQKRLQLLHDLVPNARRFGYLVNPDNVSSVATVIDPAWDAVRTWGGSRHRRVRHDIEICLRVHARSRRRVALCRLSTLAALICSKACVRSFCARSTKLLPSRCRGAASKDSF
jgi:putative tryptophan/tyrosine transport system substrate-binding protein